MLLYVPNKYKTEIELKKKVDNEDIKAKWEKRLKKLKLTLTQIWSDLYLANLAINIKFT